MRNLLGNRWGKIGLMLVMCFAVYGFMAANSYAQICCNCGAAGWRNVTSADLCTSACSIGGSYTGASYTLHTGMSCGDPCSDDAGQCFKMNQLLCDRENNTSDACGTDPNFTTPKCGVFFEGNPVPSQNWTPCQTGQSCYYNAISDTWDNYNQRTNTDENDYCTQYPYAQ